MATDGKARAGAAPADLISRPIVSDRVQPRHRSDSIATTVAVSIFLLILPAPLASVTNQDGGRALSIQPANGASESTSTAVGAERRAVAEITVHRVRIVAPAAEDKERSALIQFTLSNDSPATVRDIAITVLILRRETTDQSEEARVLAGPFYVKGSFLLEPGDVTDYEIGLRNLSPDCSCRASVGVISARIVEQP